MTWEVCPKETDQMQPRVLPPEWRRVQGPISGAYIRDDGLLVIVSVEVKTDSQLFFVINGQKLELPDRRRWLHVSLSREKARPTLHDQLVAKRAFMGPVRAFQFYPSPIGGANEVHLFSCLDNDCLPDFRHEGAEGLRTGVLVS